MLSKTKPYPYKRFRTFCYQGEMAGDQESARHTIDVYTQQGGCVVHRQVEYRDGRLFMRVQKRSVLDLI